MELGMIGLGRMGANLVRRLMRTGHQCIIYDIHPEAAEALVQDGAVAATSLEDFAQKLTKPRTLWMMVPTGEGRWTVMAAIDEAVPAPVLSAALYARFSSRGESDFADKVLSALRYEFGGHDEKSVAEK